ncbi:MAG: LysR substrate-binding domain-containing protein [Burkholderiales bacterium]|nr:LysR substrate-binding domain-containing protein [Burkholderiales bacterium]
MPPALRRSRKSWLHRLRCRPTIKGPPLVWFVSDGGIEKRFTPPPTHRLSDGEAIVDAAIGDLRLAQLPTSPVRGPIASGSLQVVLQGCSAGGVEVHAVWPRQRHLSPRVRYVVDRLVEYAAKGRLD